MAAEVPNKVLASFCVVLEADHCNCVPSKQDQGISIMMQVNSARNRCLINPSSDTIVEEGDQLIMMRPTCIASYAYKPLKKPITVDRGKL